MTTPTIIEAAHLSHAYERWGIRVEALRDVNISIRRGAWVNIIGANGSGKSTFLRLLAGLTPIQSGRLVVNGRVTEPTSHVKAGAAFMVHQDPLKGTAASLTVLENLATADPKGPQWLGRSARAKYSHLLAPVGLDRHLDQAVELLSGGQRQLLALVIAALRPAPLALLDEPFAALDPDRTEQGLALVADLQAHGKTILMVTHDRTMAIARGDAVLQFASGAASWLTAGAAHQCTHERAAE